MVIARKIAYNVLVSSVSKMLSTVLALVAIGFITRYLGTTGFGNYATILAFLSFFGAVGDLGLYSISTREISRKGADEKRIMSDIFTLRLITSLGIFLVAPFLIWLFPYSNEVRIGIVIVAASFLFSSCYQILNGVFQKKLAMDKVAISELFGKIVQVASIILAVKFGLGFNWVVASLLFYMVFSFFLVFFWSRRYIKVSLSFNIPYWRKFLRESYPIGISAVVIFIYFKVDTILLSILKNSSDVGIYNAAYKVVENIVFFPSMIMGLIFPIMAKNIFSDFSRFKDISNKTFKIFILTVVPLIIGTLFLSKNIIELIGGAGFSQASPVLMILVFALATIFFGNFFNSILIAGNLQKKLMAILASAAIFSVLTNLILIPKISYFGSAIVSVVTELIVAISSGILVFKKLKYSPHLENWSGILFSGIAMGGFLFISQGTNFVIRGIGSLLVYMFFLWITKSVKTEELTSIMRKETVVSSAQPPAF
jgi:O-antigen/teichoic acid export membrane protein